MLMFIFVVWIFGIFLDVELLHKQLGLFDFAWDLILKFLFENNQSKPKYKISRICIYQLANKKLF